MRLGVIGASVAALGLAASLHAQSPLAIERQRLAQAQQASAQALARSQSLDAAAAREQDEAKKARAEEAAVAARIQEAQADIAAAQSRIAIIERLIQAQRATLAGQQGPVVRLMAALQSLAARPPAVAIAQPGSVDDLVHVRAVLGTVIPVVQTRTAGIRGQLQHTRDLRAAAAQAAEALAEGRQRLEDQRLALTRLEAEHRLKSRDLGRSALVESDRAIALGEHARDIVDRMATIGDDNATRAALANLSGPLPRPPRAGEAAATVDAVAVPPYRLPVSGRLVTGLGELSDAGVRSRGLTFETEAEARISAPAGGKVVYAGGFRGYGDIVIIDHGQGWTTLISGLGEVDVSAGDRLSQGARIGSAISGDHPRVTVELRRKGRPVDMTALTG